MVQITADNVSVVFALKRSTIVPQTNLNIDCRLASSRPLLGGSASDIPKPRVDE